jgi:hypothetical protein
MKTEYFKKVYIKSEEDLPKEMGDYLVLRKTGYGTLLHFPFEGDVGWKADRYNWLHNVDWYLLPVTLPSDDEINDWASSEEILNNMPETLKLHIKKKIECRIEGAKWARDWQPR